MKILRPGDWVQFGQRGLPRSRKRGEGGWSMESKHMPSTDSSNKKVNLGRARRARLRLALAVWPTEGTPASGSPESCGSALSLLPETARPAGGCQPFMPPRSLESIATAGWLRPSLTECLGTLPRGARPRTNDVGRSSRSDAGDRSSDAARSGATVTEHGDPRGLGPLHSPRAQSAQMARSAFPPPAPLPRGNSHHRQTVVSGRAGD